METADRPDRTRSVGRPVHRLEDEAFLTGKGQYLDDLRLPDVLHCAFVRSPVAHGAINGIDVSAARAMPGIVAVLTMSDLQKVLSSNRMPITASTKKGQTTSTPFVLADREVAYVGEPIVLVVATSRYLAEDAAAAVEVDLAELPVVADARAAILPSSPVVRRELPDNVLSREHVGFGDIEQAFAGAAHVFDLDLWQHRGCGHSMEGRGVAVELRPGGQGVCVWSSTQMPHNLLHMLTQMLAMDEEHIRIVVPDVGGGFGPKYCLYPEEVAVPAAALLLKRNLKWVEDRRETFISSIQERDQYWRFAVAVDGDARLLGIKGTLVHDQGAYAPKPVNQPYNAATAMSGPYVLPALSMDLVIALTNKVPVSSVRGAGYPQGVFAMERAMDRIAIGLGLDRGEVRRRNLIPPEKMPYTQSLSVRSGASITYDSGNYVAAQATTLAAADWNGFPERQRRALAEGRYIGIGMANAVKGTGRGPFESGGVRIGPSGKISLFSGAAAMGQGLATALAQICADELAVSPEDVNVSLGDTSKSPLGLGGFASRQLVTAGSSVHVAAKAVAKKALRAASVILSVPEETLELGDGLVRVRNSNKNISLGEIARILGGAPGYSFPADLEPGLESVIQWRTDKLAYANACHVAEVEVEPELARVTVTRYVAFNDSGRMINPMLVEGQVHGGIVHGIGNALFELMGYDDNAQPVTTTFQEYLLPTATELPRLETIYEQTPAPGNPIGAKGVGETGTIPAAAAVISAVENALSPFKVQLSQTPIMPDALFRIVSDAQAGS